MGLTAKQFEEFKQKKIEDAKKVIRYQKDPFLFIQDMWGLTPQPILPEYKELWEEALKTNDHESIKLDMFEPFILGKHVTYQQTMIINAIKKGIRGEASWKVSVSSGHGIGKSCNMAWIVIWGLFCFPESQIPCTAPTETQMNDVLRPEVGIWLEKLPEEIKSQFVKVAGYIRVVGGEKRFARAKTGKKEQPEALAGVHSKSLVMLVIDEASGVHDEVYKSSKGALSSPTVLQLMISNPTRVDGYFYDSHHRLKEDFQTFRFSGIESPIVDRKLVQDIIFENGTDSDEYKIRILGEFPDVGGVDDDGWIPLLNKEDLRFTTNGEIRPDREGVDPGGDGGDNDIIVVRDNFKAKIESVQKKSNAVKTAQNASTVASKYGIKGDNITIDNFGVGANVAVEMAAGGIKPKGVNVGEKRGMSKKDTRRYINIRASAFWKMQQWLLKGGELINHKLRDDICMIRFKRNIAGKIQIMSKKDMKKAYGKSPDAADALMLTFVEDKDDREFAAKYGRVLVKKVL